MKLPLKVHYDHFGQTEVTDASHRILFSRKDSPEVRRFAHDMVRKMNSNWRWAWLGQQPYEYSRDEWLSEKNVKV